MKVQVLLLYCFSTPSCSVLSPAIFPHVSFQVNGNLIYPFTPSLCCMVYTLPKLSLLFFFLTILICDLVMIGFPYISYNSWLVHTSFASFFHKFFVAFFFLKFQSCPLLFIPKVQWHTQPSAL